MTPALITGAHRGLGLQAAHDLASLGWHVWLGSRDPGRGAEAARGLASLPGRVTPLALDVTDDASVEAAVEVVDDAGDPLDVLVNNAGITGPAVPPEETGPSDFLACFGVNLLGPVRVTRAFLPLLRRAEDPRVVMVSSGVGSITRTSDPTRLESQIHSLIYPSSKAALNMVTSQYARAIPDVRFTAVDPGYTATDLNGHRGHQTVEEGTAIIVRAATGQAGGPSGVFIDADGPLPW